MLRFFEIAPGQRVAELAAGGGYTAELLARVVGPPGTVYGQNSTFLLERFAEAPWTARLEKEVMKNVVRVDRDFDAPLPPEAHDLDAVLMVLFYHDMVWMEVDRDALNSAVYEALRPGGIYGIVDHSAQMGDGVADVQTLHRIEESVVLADLTRAGFELDGEADFLRNPQDKRDWNASPRAAGPRRGQSDRFVLRFRKPMGPSDDRFAP
jgi:predicted methyltransferase